MSRFEHESHEAARAMLKLIKPHVICEDLRVVCQYSAREQCYKFTIFSHNMNFVVETKVSEEAHQSTPIQSVVQIGRSFLDQFQKKHPQRYIEDAE